MSWSEAVLAVLPHGLSGAAAASPAVRMHHIRALATARTNKRTVTDWIEEVVRRGRPDLLAEWREELEMTCAIAITTYERVRGEGPSVAPVAEVG
jgi:hypothetical protein